MNGAESIAAEIGRAGLARVYAHAGGTISRILEAIDNAGVKVIVAANEAQAVHMAQGAFRASGKAQVAIVTSGPGVTNAMTGVADAFYDADAIVVLCGQVATDWMRKGEPIRQRGFQETPTVELMQPICKAAYLVLEAAGAMMATALLQAAKPRPGPIVLDLPMDMLKAGDGNRGRSPDYSAPRLASPSLAAPRRATKSTRILPCLDHARVSVPELVREFMEVFRMADHRLIVAGRGCLTAVSKLREFAATEASMIVTSLPAVGVGGSLEVGFIGHTGTRQANRLVANSDVILVLGARLDVRQTGTLTDEWARGKTIASVDYDAGELEHRRVPVDYPFHCSAEEWLEEALRW